MVESTYEELKQSRHSYTLTRVKTEAILLSQAQRESFPDQFKDLKAGKEISPQSHLLSLSPQFDSVLELIREGGRLQQ